MTMELWQEQTRAVALLSEIEAFHRADGDDVEHDPFFKVMWNHIFAPKGSWFDAPTAMTLDPMTRRALRAISQVMANSDALPVLEELELDALRETLKQARDLLAEAPAPTDDRRRHILYLLDRAVDLASGDDVDLVGLRSLTFEATGAAIGDQRLWAWGKAREFFGKLGWASAKFGARVGDAAAVNLVLETGAEGVKLLTAGG